MSAASEFERLAEILRILRSPVGCPWDQKQTHQSIRDNLIEETYEALEAIDEKNSQALKEELGDLLLHVVFHAQIATENDEYTLEDVIRDINHKLERRHPHVFGEEKTKGINEVISLWEGIKKKERRDKKTTKGVLGGVPTTMPALIYAQEIQTRAKGIGFDWESDENVLEKLCEEIKEVSEASSKEEQTHEFGDVLFTLTNLANRWGISLEEALHYSNKKFCSRFKAMEDLAEERKQNFNDMTLKEKDALWNEVKSVRMQR